MSIIVRRVLPNEYHKYRSHLKLLDTDSKVLRFGSHISDEVIDKLCEKIESSPSDHVLFCVEDDKLNFIAVGHIALGQEPELAFSVHREHQRKGIGSLLMDRCVNWCRAHNILQGTMMCLSRNTAIKRLCIKHNIQLHTESGETIGNIKLSTPDATTFIKENINGNLGIIDYLSKRTMLFWTFFPEKA